MSVFTPDIDKIRKHNRMYLRAVVDEDPIDSTRSRLVNTVFFKDAGVAHFFPSYMTGEAYISYLEPMRMRHKIHPSVLSWAEQFSSPPEADEDKYCQYYADENFKRTHNTIKNSRAGRHNKPYVPNYAKNLYGHFVRGVYHYSL